MATRGLATCASGDRFLHLKNQVLHSCSSRAHTSSRCLVDAKPTASAMSCGVGYQRPSGPQVMGLDISGTLRAHSSQVETSSLGGACQHPTVLLAVSTGDWTHKSAELREPGTSRAQLTSCWLESWGDSSRRQVRYLFTSAISVHSQRIRPKRRKRRVWAARGDGEALDQWPAGAETHPRPGAGLLAGPCGGGAGSPMVCPLGCPCAVL